jgi:hypothetical protein
MRRAVATAFTALALLLASASVAQATPPGIDRDRGCVYAGQRITFYSGISPFPTCYSTPDDSQRPTLAPIDGSRTPEDLAEVQAWSPLDPDHYVARGTMATAGIPSGAPLDPDSDAIAANVGAIADYYLPSEWDGRLRTGLNVDGGYGPGDNVPIYVVDSANPHQERVTFSSTDPRVTNFPGIVRVNSGTVPLPDYARPSSGGDRALAVFDVSTGIWRSYFGATERADGTWTYAAGGYWYGNVNSLSAGMNYYLALVQGTSSVVGLSNELTQIGVEELVDQDINHMVSVTFPDYRPGASFPAKQSDGRMTSLPAPRAGQIFTFPEDFDVDAYADANRVDPYTRAIMHAVKDYGGIVTDRNVWSTAFNVESPLGYPAGAAPHATPEGSAALRGTRINSFPWQETAWLAPNTALSADNTSEQRPIARPGS